MQRILTLSLVFCFCSFLSAQMATPQGPRYGNEWLENGKSYLRIGVAEDGMYTVDAATLSAAGFDLGEAGSRLRLQHFGEEVPLEVTATGARFFGRRGRGELDAYLFEPTVEPLNPRYGMYTDTAVYYLSEAVAGTQVQRISQGAAVTGTSPVTEIVRTAEVVYSEHQSKFIRRQNGSTIVFSHYDLAEGYGSRPTKDLLSSNGSTLTTAELELPGAVAGTATLDLRFSVAFGEEHRQQISVDGRNVGEVTSNVWAVMNPTYTVPTDGNNMTVTLSGQSGSLDKANLAYVSVDYPAAPSFGGNQLTFSLPAGPARSITFGSLPVSTRLYDLTAARFYTPGAGGTFSLPASASESEFALVADFMAPASTAPLSLRAQLPPAEATYLLLASRRLQGEGLQEIARYRASAAGGSYRVHVAYIEDVYDAFGYGVQRHPQAIRNYLAAAIRTAPGLDYLFLVGKGREYTDLRTAAQLAAAGETFFIPSFGLPSSDNLLSALPGESTPRLATGRLPAITPEEVSIYVRKLRAVEEQVDRSSQTIEDTDWMKQALFLGGGQTANEQATIRLNLARIEEIFENSKLGGNVTSVYRTSTDPIESTRQEAIFERINAGVMAVTFYGHSSSQGFDFNIDNPDNWDNEGKFPLIVSLGCYSGDAFTEARSISERFLFLPDGGAVSFAASKGLGYLSALGGYGRRLYDHIGNDQYGEGIGSSIRATVADYEGTGNFTIGILIEQFSLTGDPAFRFHPRPGPDLVIDPASITFAPAIIPAQDSSYALDLRLLNLGTKDESVPDSMLLGLQQQLPSGEVRDLRQYHVAVPRYEELVNLRVSNLGFEAVGLNRLLITVDATDVVAEQPAGAEANNEVRSGGEPGVPFTVVANTARAVFPPPYGVVGPGVELVASSTDPLAPERDYRIQVSTELNFAPLLIDEEVTSAGGVIRYTPPLPGVDSTTYYWRISPDSASTQDAGYIWNQSSFTYLKEQRPDSVDFALQHPGQLASGTTDDLIVSANQPEWAFGRNTNDVELFNAVYRSSDFPRLVWNGTRFASPFRWRLSAAVQVLVVDSTVNFNWMKSDGSYGAVVNGNENDYWAFDTRTQPGRKGLMDFLEEGIPPGKYVILYSAQRGEDIEYHNADWAQDSLQLGKSIYSVLENEGAEQVRLLQELGSVPYTLVYQKGVGKMAEAIASSQDDTTAILVPLLENRLQGSYRSDRIGPSLDWQDMVIRFLPGSIGTADSCYLRVYGEDEGGQVRELEGRTLRVASEREFTVDLRQYAADTYPYLSVGLDLFDAEYRTAPSVDNIYVRYQRPGDVAVSPSIAYQLADSLQQGETAHLEVGYENVARTGMDSLLVQLTVIDQANQTTTLRKRQAPLPAGASDRVAFDLPTDGVTGRLRLQLMLNPEGDQPEHIYFNNLLTTGFGVDDDRIAPDLKVYFDGRRIRNGELISARPEILVQLRDENTYRRLDDSSAYAISLTHPDGTQETIRMSDRRVEYLPATTTGDGENMAEVYFRPELLQDGPYSLTVQATDRAANRSGAYAYQQSFEVINQQLVSNVLAYPNPFTTQTQFVYTLTGSTPPETFRVQIMTVSGRVVRDIDLLAQETISVGTHRTDFTWDGTDEYGDPLANGVYLYRVITGNETGQAIENYDNGTNQYFKQGLGKVVILR